MKLSICIPTFNRRKELIRLIESLELALVQHPICTDLEIIISDNASTDGTDVSVREMQKRLTLIRYFRNECNLGFAKNLNNAISMAQGEYFWLMGSDEVILPDAINRILCQMKSETSVIVGNPITNSLERKFFMFEGQRDQEIKSQYDYALYLSFCREFSSVFAFMSTLIIQRQFWFKIECTQYENEHAYTHMLRIIRGLILTGGTVRSLNAPLVLTGNSGNEYNATVLPHFELDLKTIDYLVTTIHRSSPEMLEAYGAIFRRQYDTVKLLKSRVECKSERWSSMVPLLRKFNYSSLLLQKSIFDPLLLAMYLLIKKLRKARNLHKFES